MFERLTAPSREVLARAGEQARRLRQDRVGTEHLLLAVLEERSGTGYRVLRESGVDGRRLHAEVRQLVGSPPRVFGDADATALLMIGIDLYPVLRRIDESFGPGAPDDPAPIGTGRATRRVRRGRSGAGRLSPPARKALSLSLHEAVRLGHRYLGPEHLLLGLLREGDGPAARILTEAGLSLDDLRAGTVTAGSTRSPSRPSPPPTAWRCRRRRGAAGR